MPAVGYEAVINTNVRLTLAQWTIVSAQEYPPNKLSLGGAIVD